MIKSKCWDISILSDIIDDTISRSNVNANEIESWSEQWKKSTTTMTAKASNGKQRAHSTHNDNCFSSFSFRGRWCSFCFCFCFSFHRHLSTHYRSRANFMSNLIWLREKCQQMFLYKYPSIYPYKKKRRSRKRRYIYEPENVEQQKYKWKNGNHSQSHFRQTIAKPSRTHLY